jgi:hypothetical protein
VASISRFLDPEQAIAAAHISRALVIFQSYQSTIYSAHRRRRSASGSAIFT